MAKDLERTGNKCKGFESEVLEAKSRIDDLKSAKCATEAKCSEVETLLTGSQQQVEYQLQVKAKLEAEKEDLQQALNKTKVDLEAQNETCHKLEMNLEGKCKTLQELSQQLTFKEETVSQIQSQIKNLQNEKHGFETLSIFTA